MSTTLNSEQLERLVEIKEEIRELLDEAYGLVRGTSEEARAKGYWYAHARMALDNDHDYLGRGGYTLQETIDALEEGQDEENEEEVEHE
jgi:hypothetical protein